MANKSSSIARKLWLANGSAVLAIASLFSIGFSAWAEVGGETTAEVGELSINVNAIGEGKLLPFFCDSFYIHNTGFTQGMPLNETDNDRFYTDSPYFTFYVGFETKVPNNANAILDVLFTLECANTNLVSANTFSYQRLVTDKKIESKEEYISKVSDFSDFSTIPVDNILSTTLTDKYVYFIIKWVVSTAEEYSKAGDFYSNIVNGKTNTFTLTIENVIVDGGNG